MTDTRTFEHALTVDVPREQVFHALTDAGQLKRWWITDGLSEPRPGGRFRYEWRMEDPANDHVQAGTYDALVEGERVEFPWSGPGGDSHVAVTLQLPPPSLLQRQPLSESASSVSRYYLLLVLCLLNSRRRTIPKSKRSG
jgi:uncharacterized protein YndB with AHSA1/START domain